MIIPIGTRIPPHLGKQGIEAVVTTAKAIGLGALDLPSPSREAFDIVVSNGLRVGTVDVQGVGQLLSGNADTRKQAVSRVGAQIEEVAELGGKVAFMCLVPEDREQKISTSLQYYEETFSQIGALCDQVGVRIALEGYPGPGPHFSTLGYTPEVWRAMFAAVPSTAIGLCFDPSHLVRLGIDHLRVFEEFKERIYHCHGKDTQLLSEAQYLYGHLPARLTRPAGFSDGSWRYCIPGEGEVDWRRVAFNLQSIGYEGVVSIELEDARYWGTLELEQQGIQKAFNHLSQNLH